MRRWWLTGGVWLLCALPCFSRTTMLNDMPDTCRMTVETHPAVSDPELTAIDRRFVREAACRHNELTPVQSKLIACVCLTGLQALPQLRDQAREALRAGVSPEQLREAIYLCAPFIGFPRTEQAVATLNEVFAEAGLPLPLPSQATVAEADRHSRGAAIQQPLYGNEIRDAFAGLPDGMGARVADLLTEVCFGDFYTRGGLDVPTRELLSLVLLTTLGAERQIAAHTAGNLRAGNDRATLCAALIQCLPYAGFPAVLNALRIVKSVAPES